MRKLLKILMGHLQSILVFRNPKCLEELLEYGRICQSMLFSAIDCWRKTSPRLLSQCALRSDVASSSSLGQGLVSKLVSLTDDTSTRLIGLRSLSEITHHPTLYTQDKLEATALPVLTRLIQSGTLDAQCTEHIVVIIAHTVSSPILNIAPHLLHMQMINLPVILSWILSNMHNPDASHNTLVHAFGFLADITAQNDIAIRSMPTAVRAIVGALHSRDTAVRCNALGAVFRLNISGAEDPQRFFDPYMYLTAAQARDRPKEVVKAMLAYGVQECEMTVALKCHNEIMGAIMENAENGGKDMIGLGEKLGRPTQRVLHSR